MSQKTTFPTTHTEGTVTAGHLAVYKTTGDGHALQDGGAPSSISSLTLLTADPGAPADDTWWAVRDGATPTMTVSVKARIAGVTYTIASITL